MYINDDNYNQIVCFVRSFVLILFTSIYYTYIIKYIINVVMYSIVVQHFIPNFLINRKIS